MTKITQGKIYDKLMMVDNYLSYLYKIKKEIKNENQFIEDFHFFGLAERYLQLLCQIIIDILNLIIIEQGIKKPESNQEIISILFNNKIISEDLASRLDGIVGFRNILVHEYEEIDKKIVYRYLIEKIDDFEIFKKEILKYIKSKNS